MSASSFSHLSPPPPPPPRRRRTTTPSLTAISRASVLSPVSRTLAEIEKSGVIACLRADDGNLAVEAACAALDGGVTCLEIVMSTPGVLEVLQRLLEEYPSLTIGVGTVLSVEDAWKAVDVGAKFLMSPGTVMEILLNLQGGDVLYIPGVMTPTEVLSAYNAGARIVKVYPVSVLGGDKYISTLKRPFPRIPMIASQGITIDSVERYMEAGAAAVVLSDAIFEKEAMRKRDFDAVYRLARLATLEVSNGTMARGDFSYVPNNNFVARTTELFACVCFFLPFAHISVFVAHISVVLVVAEFLTAFWLCVQLDSLYMHIVVCIHKCFCCAHKYAPGT